MNGLVTRRDADKGQSGQGEYQMAFFTSEGLQIAYEVYGTGKPIVLVHGFGSNAEVNWVNTGWVETLNQAGYQAVTLDNRGHGKSEKLYDPAYYPAREMAKDVANLIDHLDIGPAFAMGYSMGARICAHLGIDAPEKVSALILGGLGINLVHGMADSSEIIEALEAERLDQVTGKVGRQYRIFADHTKSDRLALAACMRATRTKMPVEEAQKLTMPVLVAVGSEDDVAGSGPELADLLPNGEALVIPNRDHMRATGDKIYKDGAVSFLDQVSKSS
jgi:pimeloyl-ACP methyl ester carboxylesterase